MRKKEIAVVVDVVVVVVVVVLRPLGLYLYSFEGKDRGGVEQVLGAFPFEFKLSLST